MEEELENLGDHQLEWPHVANQLIFYLLVEPAVHQNLPNTLADWMSLEQHLMRTYAHEEPKAVQYERVAILWAR